MAEQRPVNWWVRTQVGALTLLLVGMAAYRFWLTEPQGTLDSWLILLVLLIIVLMLSEAFDSFSVGKLLSFSREVQKKEQEVAKLEERNAQLLAQLITVSAQQSQSQSHTSVFGDYHAAPRVEKASPEEVQKRVEDEASEEAIEAAEEAPEPAPAPRRILSGLKMEELGLEHYLQLKGYAHDWVLREAKLVSDFRDLDTISNTAMLFDAFVRAPGKDIFVEVRRARFASQSLRDRVYMMLSKIDHYRRKKNVDAHLDLVLVGSPTAAMRPRDEERLLDEFQPALATGLLQIVRIELTAEEEETAARYVDDNEDAG